MKTLSLGLRSRAEKLLHVYGGVDGLSKHPPWLVSFVLKTWFTEAERKQILEFIYQSLKPDARLPLFKELGIK